MSESEPTPPTGVHLLHIYGADHDPEWDIEHPDDCPVIQRVHLGDVSIMGYECGVGYQIDAIGLDLGAWPMEPGDHQIKFWSEKFSGPDFIVEYDAGLICVDDCPHPSHLVEL